MKTVMTHILCLLCFAEGLFLESLARDYGYSLAPTAWICLGTGLLGIAASLIALIRAKPTTQRPV